MNDVIKNVLTKIESNGFIAYVVGGYVRDFLIGKNSNDVDICTNATPKELNDIFNEINIRDESYGSIRLRIDDYNFDITTFRSEIKYDNRKPVMMNYVSDVKEDIKRRDFTINTILMNSNGDIIDYLDGKKDVFNSLIRGVLSSEVKFKEDPLRMLRAIRFASILNFKLDDEVSDAINNNKDLIRDLSYTRKKEELDKILLNENCIYGISLIKHYDLENILDIKINDIKYTNDICGMWSQIEYSDKYIFTKEENKNIKNIKEIISYGKIDRDVLYKYDLYISMVAGNILGYSNRRINIIYNSLPIKNIHELDINNNDIINTLNISPSKILKSVIMLLEKKVLDGELINKKNVLINYLIEHKMEVLNDKE